MIDLSELTFDEDISREVIVLRSSGGYFGAGGWVETEPVTISVQGIVTPATAQELRQVPQGDRVDGALTISTATRLYRTRTQGQGATVQDSTQALSDRIVSDGDTYRVARVWPWGDQGFWKAVAVREAGA